MSTKYPTQARNKGVVSTHPTENKGVLIQANLSLKAHRQTVCTEASWATSAWTETPHKLITARKSATSKRTTHANLKIKPVQWAQL